MRAFHAALDGERVRRGLSWAQVARQSGVSASTIARAATADDMEADGMLFLAGWLGTSPEAFLPGRRDVPATMTGPSRADTALMHAELDTRRTARRLTWDEVAAELGVPRVTGASLARLGRRNGRTTAQLLLAVARWLDRPVNAFTHAVAGPRPPSTSRPSPPTGTLPTGHHVRHGATHPRPG